MGNRPSTLMESRNSFGAEKLRTAKVVVLTDYRGLTVKQLEDLRGRLRAEGVDYVAFGPVYATPGRGEPTGLAALAQAARVAGGVAVYALGGVTLERFGELAAAGAAMSATGSSTARMKTISAP